jgi:Domain of unknown function (DUF5916)
VRYLAVRPGLQPPCNLPPPGAVHPPGNVVPPQEPTVILPPDDRPAATSRALRGLGLAVAPLLAAALFPPAASGEQTAAGSTAVPIEIHRITTPIVVDGDLSDPGWQEAARVTTWYETNPGDNLEPKERNVGYLGYDDRYFYAAFEFEDPHPETILAPLGDHDNVPSYTDYGGVIIDATNDHSTAQMFLANPRGIQYDAISSDASGEDSSPDFYWDSAGRITPTGWVLEIRIPFSSLRYGDSNPEQWGILLYRNHPREFRYQMFTSRMPRDTSCFICNVRPLVGLENLPSGRHWVVAPYLNASRLTQPEGDLGTPLASGGVDGELGVDAKWIPNPSTVIDAAVNPDFSQVESDVAQIAANERFALFFPERRPFFLESIDLFTTPLQAVNTRTFTQPRWGARATGRVGDANTYTLLVGQDEGGGSVILPGPNSSDLAEQDFESTVAIGRWRHDFGGRSFASFLYSGREIDGGGSNRVLGPDVRWQPTDSDTVSGQLLYSTSDTPRRPDLAAEWDGRHLAGYAGQLWWSRQTTTWDYFLLYRDVAEDFRADNGFIPQVGYRYGNAEVGYTFRPVDKPVSRLRLFAINDYKVESDGAPLFKGITPGFAMDTLWNSFVRVEFAFEDVRGIERTFRRNQIRPQVTTHPGRIVSQLSVSATLGDEIDFANDRLGRGTTVTLSGDLRPTDHLQLTVNASRRALDVTAEDGRSGRLFTAEVGRLRTVYTFTARSWLRLIGQWTDTARDPSLYASEVDERSRTFSGSVVFAYKLNWQTVLFVGGSDNRALDGFDRLQVADRQLFLKLSYAFQG